MSENFLIRDVFNQRNVKKLGEDLKKSYPLFNITAYEKRLSPLFIDSSFSERKKTITECLIDLLPEDVERTIDILTSCLPEPYSDDGLDGDMDRFIVASMADAVSRIGINHFHKSMSALKLMTQSFSAEWAIRPFIEKFPDDAHFILLEWSMDKNAHVRRLVSEGTRPYLPWGKKLSITDKDAEWSLSLLEQLMNDTSPYVRTSVANHLNDLTKKHPDTVLRFLNSNKIEITNYKPIPFFKKALRNLIKAGNADALELIGYSPEVKAEINITKCPVEVLRGEKLNFNISITSTSSDSQEVLIDFIIHFYKSNGSLSPKVFKLTSFTLSGNSTKTIDKSFSFKPITTRKYYPGPHLIEIMVNGNVKARKKFELV